MFIYLYKKIKQEKGFYLSAIFMNIENSGINFNLALKVVLQKCFL